MMKNNLSKSANSVQTCLKQNGLTCKVIELSDSTRTAIEAANAIGCQVAQIVKSLLFYAKTTNEPVLILVSGVNRVNEKHIAKLLDDDLVKADANFAREVTGFAIGGIPPVGHKQVIKHVFIDEDLLKFVEVWAAAGTPHAVFSINPDDLVKLTNSKIISVK